MAKKKGQGSKYKGQGKLRAEFIPFVSERNYGIELLRVLSMVFVVALHVLDRGGIYLYAEVASNLAEHPWNYKVAWILETAAYGAVDFFALISGFVGLRSKWATKKYLRLWVLVAFWGVVMVLLVDKGTAIIDGMNSILKGIIPCIRTNYEVYEFLGTEYRDAIFSVATKQYWYFNAYTLLFFLMPVLNAAIAKLNKKQLSLVVFGLFMLTSVYRTVAGIDLFVMDRGYSAMWLMIVYLMGATVRLHYEDGFRPSKWICFVGYLLCTALSVGWRFYMDSLIKKYPENETYADQRMRLISYTAPFIVIGSVFLLLLFMQIKVHSKSSKKVIGVLSGSSFAVYIIHVQPVFWKYYMRKRFYLVAYEPTPKMLQYTLTAIFSIYIVCTILELLRQTVFKFTRLDRLIDFLGDKIDSFVAKIVLESKAEAELETK